MGTLLAAGYSALGLSHAALGLAALVLGGWIFAAGKGTALHVRLGWAYVASMVCLNASALSIYRLTGRFNLFHALAIVSLAMVLAGVAQVVFRVRIRNWLWRHYQHMSWSYVGLVAATCNEAFVRVPAMHGAGAPFRVAEGPG